MASSIPIAILVLTTTWSAAAQHNRAAQPPVQQPFRAHRLTDAHIRQSAAGSTADALSNPAEHPDGYVAICAVIKDQGVDLPFWLKWHEALGVNKFYIFDNNSSRPLSVHMQDRIMAGVVQYTWFDSYPGSADQQGYQWAYDRCIENYAGRHRFIAFIDADEFIVLREPRQGLPAFLRQYEAYGGLAVSWEMFGSSGHEQRPADPNPFNNYDMCRDPNTVVHHHVKVIVNTAHVQNAMGDPHQFQMQPGSPLAVTEDMQPINGFYTPQHKHQHIQLYHFVTKSQEDFVHKMDRGQGAHRTDSNPGYNKDWKFFNDLNALCTVNCTEVYGRPELPAGFA